MVRHSLCCLSLLVSLWLTPGRSAAELPWVNHDFFNNAGGLNNGFDATIIAPNEASDLQNVVFTLGGALKKRQGFAPINSVTLGASATTTGLVNYRLANGTRFLVATVDNGATDTLQQMPYAAGIAGPTGTWSNITGALTLAWTADNVADFAVAQDVLVIEDGVNTTAPYRWNGTGNAIALGGSPPNATMVEYHKNHLFLAGNDTNPSTLYFSNLGDISTWTGTDTINVETNDGQVIRGLKSALDCLYVFKDRSIWRVCGTSRDDFTLEQMVKTYGTLSNASIELIDNTFYFQTADGLVARYDGGINVQIISPKIQGTITGLNAGRLAVARAAALDAGTGQPDYYLSVSDGNSATHNLVLVFNTLQSAWSKFSGLNANALATYEVGTVKQALMFGDYAGVVHKYPTTNADNGAAINAYYKSGWLRFPDIPQNKIFRLLRVFANQEGTGNNLTVCDNLDFETTGTCATMSLAGSQARWDSALWDQDVWADLTTAIGRFEINRGTDFFQWVVQNTAANQPFTVKGVQVWVEPTGRIGGIR